MTSQNLVKQIDITGLTTVTGSEINQLLETALLADDKSINLYTVDTALNTPDVPDPTQGELEGVDVEFWKRYMWIRIPHTSAGVDARVKKYTWNPNVASIDTYLRWRSLEDLVEQVENTANIAEETANNAQDDANAAVTLVNTLNNTVTNLSTTVTNLSTTVNELETRVSTLEDEDTPSGGSGGKIIGEIFDYLGTDIPTGCLRCDGSTISRTTYATLFTKIGTRFGAGDGSTTFALPDAVDRTVFGADHVSYIPATGGANTVTIGINNLPAHRHEGGSTWLEEKAPGTATYDLVSNTSGMGPVVTSVSGPIRNEDGSAVAGLGTSLNIMPAHIRAFKLIKAL
jgi:microcystin-dependent protein